MLVERLRPGLWRWTATCPGPEGEREVGCVYLEAPDAVVLVDPLVPPAGTADAERFWRALDGDVARLGRPVAVLLTSPAHARSAAAMAERYGARRWGPSDPAGALPGGVAAIPVPAMGEVLLWIADHRALVAGHALVGTPEGGLRLGRDDPSLRDALRPALALPVELILPSHGRPVLEGGADALVRALA